MWVQKDKLTKCLSWDEVRISNEQEGRSERADEMV